MTVKGINAKIAELIKLELNKWQLLLIF
jgi:hypothetical protein